MICKKCGAKIQEGCVYCSVCGTEVQLVPDYNLLDEDILSGILQKEAIAESQKSFFVKKEKRKLSKIIWGFICVVLILALLTLFFVFQEIKIRHRNTYEYQYQTAEEFLEKGDSENAVSHLKNALELRPDDRQAKEKLLEIYLSKKEDASAIAILEEFVEENKRDKESVQKLIALYGKNQEYKKINSLCDQVKNSDMLDLFADYMVDQPKFSKISGTYPHPIKISISSAKNYDIFYTTDGKDPASYGRLYEGELSLDEEGTTSVCAVAKNEKGICSEPVKAEYTIRYEPPAMPSVTPAGGTYNEPQMITIHVPQECTAYYTWDGTTPSECSFRYAGPLEMPQGNQVLSVILVNSAGLKSSIYRVNYIYMP